MSLNPPAPTSTIVLSEQTRKTVRYRLLSFRCEKGVNYYVYIQFGQERITRLLPARGEENARQLFRILVNGGVTPCTLDDILEDWTYEIKTTSHRI